MSHASSSEVVSSRPSINLPLGQLLSTPGAIEAMAQAGQNPMQLLDRHRTGDWGDLCAEDRAANDAAVEQGERILSAYTLTNGTKLWIISERDRSVTTILRPDEY